MDLSGVTATFEVPVYRVSESGSAGIAMFLTRRSQGSLLVRGATGAQCLVGR